MSERTGMAPPPFARDLTATAALAAYSLAVGIGYGRVFSGWDFARDMVLLVLVGHGSSFAMRRGQGIWRCRTVWCCSRPRARASTCSLTTRNAAANSRRKFEG